MRLVQFLGIAAWFCHAHSHVPEILGTLGCQLASQNLAHHEQALPAVDIGGKSQDLGQECGLFAWLEESSFLGSPEELETDLAPTGVQARINGVREEGWLATPQFLHCSWWAELPTLRTWADPQQEVQATTSLAKACRADLWRVLCQKDFGSSTPKSYLLNVPRWMLSLSSMGLLCLFPSSHWSGNN